MAAFACMLGLDYKFFLNLIYKIYDYFKQKILFCIATLLKYFVWKRYSNLSIDVAFMVLQIGCAIDLIVLSVGVFVTRCILNRKYKHLPTNYHYTHYGSMKKGETRQLAFVVLLVN